MIDLRGTARGDLDDGVAAARLFVGSGTLAVRSKRGRTKNEIAKETSSPRSRPTARSPRPSCCSSIRAPSGAAEVFAAALDGNKRAELVGERTLGRAARQRLVKLPDGSGLLLSTVRYLTPVERRRSTRRGSTPDVEVDRPDVEFGADPPAGDPTLDKALEQYRSREARPR